MSAAAAEARPASAVKPGDRVIRLKRHLCFIGCEVHGEDNEGYALHEVGVVWDSTLLAGGRWYLRVGWLHHPSRAAEATEVDAGTEVLVANSPTCQWRA